MFADDELPSLASRFARFAAEVRGRSPLYESLSHGVARDPSAAFPLDAAQETQRRPNLLYAAVHDVLMSGVDHPLRDYYPTLGGARAPDEQSLTTFRSFVAAHHERISGLVMTRNTQTNEPGRCAALAPALAWVSARMRRPVALVELGASAGLLLHLDRYGYRYGDEDRSSPSANVVIAAQRRGGTLPHTWLPTITTRVGIDLQPLSPSDPRDVRWLRACVWPEHVDRLQRLDDALATAAQHDDVEMVGGDLVSELAPTVRHMPSDVLVCVLHSAALAYLDAASRSTIERDLDALGAERDLARISFEGTFFAPFAQLDQALPAAMAEEERFLLGVTTWEDGHRTDTLLGRSHSHGAWLEWLAG